MPSTRSRREVDARRKRVGDVIKGRYKILSVIGKGGMSRVYLAADLQLTNKQWAVKEVDRNATDPTGRPIEQSLSAVRGKRAKVDAAGVRCPGLSAPPRSAHRLPRHEALQHHAAPRWLH